MAKLVLIHDNGTQEVLRDEAPNDGYIAMKLWSMEDVQGVIDTIEEANDDTINYIELADFKYLEECDDAEWDVINYAVESALKRQGRLPRLLRSLLWK